MLNSNVNVGCKCATTFCRILVLSLWLSLLLVTSYGLAQTPPPSRPQPPRNLRIAVGLSSPSPSPTPSPSPNRGTSTATFVKTDTTTQGTWKGVYGADGYSLAEDPSSNNPSLPSYATVAVTGNSDYTWAASTGDVRAPQKAEAGSTDRLAGCWYKDPGFSIDIHLTDGQAHQVALYALDWDNSQNGRQETVQAIDDVTGTVLDTRTLSAFSGGAYLVWNLQGNVTLKVTNNAGSTNNAAISGVFFDPAATPSGKPTAVISGLPSTSPEGSAIAITGSATDANPAFTAFTYSWSVTKNAAAFTTGRGGQFSFTPDDNGPYVVSLTASDTLGLSSDPVTATVLVTNVAPTAQFLGAPYYITVGVPLTLRASVTDPSAVDTAAGFTTTWEFGDGAPQVSGLGLLTPSHTYSAIGTFTLRLTATDKDGATSTIASSTVTVSSGNVQVPQEPLLHQSDLQYIGAFRMPNYTDATDQFSYGGNALAFNPANNSLFTVGHHQSVSEISIPTSIVNSTNLGSLATATMLQPWKSVTPVLSNTLPYAPSGPIGGLIVANGQLIGTQFSYYDGAYEQVTSHFIVSSLDLASATVSGLYQVGSGGRILAGYMTEIPSEWQSILGAPYMTGQADLSIISTVSSGPAAFGFDPSRMASGTSPRIPYVSYPADHELGPYTGPANPMQSGTGQVRGMIFPPGTGSVLFFGSSGTNYGGYGLSQDYGDMNYGGSYGAHSLNGEYSFQVWAYRASDFVAVKQGTKQHWQVFPYYVWNFKFPISLGTQEGGAVAFDPVTSRVYVAMTNVDREAMYSCLPIIQVFQLHVPSMPQSPAAPEIGTLAATPSTIAPGAIPAGTLATLTAGNVYAITAGASVAQVAFYLDTNKNGTLDIGTDRLLGQGTGTANMPDGSSTNWAVVINTTGMTSGTNTVFAQATDSNGLTSTPIAARFTVSYAPLIDTLTAVPSGTSLNMTANNVRVITSGATITKVAFYLDVNSNGVLDIGTDTLLGTGSKDGSTTNWLLTVPTTGMAAGSYTAFAQATDSNGLTSVPIAATFQISP
jgi:hypothetical protein